MKAQAEIRGTSTAPLLYWLAVVCGLTGISVIRMDEPAKVVPIWFGAIVGISLGQLVAVLRIRIWTAALVALMSSWIIGPAIYVGLCELFGFGADTETALFALLPAFVCGYASLTERGALLAFWYPAMLWMLVILDGEAPGSFAPRAYLPMAIGLGVIFVAFLRARETRRANLWRAYSHTRLATPGENTVLSGSPVRGMSQLAFTGLVGGGAFLLAAWIAPNLFQKDRALHQKLAQVPAIPRYDHDSNMPCCPESWQTEKFKEYMPLRNERESKLSHSLACSYCPAQVPADEWGPYGTHRGAGIREMGPTVRYDYGYYASSDLTYAYNADGTTTYSWSTNPGNGNGYGGYGGGSTYAPAPTYVPPTPTPNYPSLHYPTYVPPVVDPIPPDPTPPVVKVDNKKKTTKTRVVAPPTVPVARPVVAVNTPKVIVSTPKEPAHLQAPELSPPHATHGTPPDPSAPWGILLPLLAGVFLLPLGTRFVRRQVTVRHLARPFWKETVDQRISNHWQRMLVGLRDAGIQLRPTEQPGAFAKRISIKGMDECATILERVRHGVRVEDEDLVAMDKTAGEIYGTARKKAGVAGRIAGSFRWPLV